MCVICHYLSLSLSLSLSAVCLWSVGCCDDIFDISARKFKDHVVYSRIVQDQARIENNYKIMDLSKPMIDDREIQFLEDLMDEELPDLEMDLFMQLYNEDQLGGMIRNLEIWIKDNFSQFKGYTNDATSTTTIRT